MKINKKIADDAEMQPTPKTEEVDDNPITFEKMIQLRPSKIIKVAHLTPDAGPIIQAYEDEWIDLRCSKDFNIGRWGRGFLPLGIKTELPMGYEAILAARSSLFKNFNLILTNGIGVVDNGYRGEWMLSVINFSGYDVVVPAGSRVAQFRIQEVQPRIIIEETPAEDLAESERGEGGYGSTGIE